MYFILCLMLIVFGISIAGAVNFMPLQMIYQMPAGFTTLMFMVGMILAIVGFIILWLRAKRVGANHLIAPPRPDVVLWLYILKDNLIRIIPVKRFLEQTQRSTELESVVYDMKAYRLGDHTARLVLDSVGHTVDARMCIYANVLQKEHDIQDIRALRYHASKYGQLVDAEESDFKEEVAKK